MLTHKTQGRNEDVPSPWMFQAGACARFLGSWPVIVGRRSKIFQAALIIDKSDDPSSCFEKSLRLPTATAFGSLGCADFRSLEAWSCDECPGVVWSPKRTIRHPEQIPNSRDGEWWIPSGKLTWLWKITILNGKTHYKWWFSIAMLNYQRIVALSNLKPSTCWFSQAIHGEDALCVYSVSTSSHQMPFAFLLTCL